MIVNLEFSVGHGANDHRSVPVQVRKAVIRLKQLPHFLLILLYLDAVQHLAQTAVELIKIFAFHRHRVDEENLVVGQQRKHFFRLFGQHLVEGQRTVPLLVAEVNDQRNDGNEPVVLRQPGKVLVRVFSIAVLPMLCRQLAHLLFILQHVVEHVADGHGVMHTRLVLDAQNEIGTGLVFFDGKRLEDIPVFLRGFGLSLLLRCKRNGDLRRIHFAELVRTNDLPAGIDQVVESVGEDFAFGHVLFGYGILQSHRTIPS